MGSPATFLEAVEWMAKKGIMPTHLGTAELRELSREVREQSFFSARNYLEQVLDGQKKVIESILAPQESTREDRVTAENPEGRVTEGFNPVTARVRIKELLDEAGYEAAPGEEGTIKDLRSDQRINLVVETNLKLAQGRGMQIAGEDETLMELWPGWELYRQEDRMEKRDWLARWMLAGGQSGRALNDGWTVTPEGRMYALKGHPIWERLGSSELFEDALDVDHPPFAFRSGMWVRPVDRKTCQAAGIMS